MKKIILSVFVLIIALAMLMTPVFAGGNNANLPDESEVQPRASRCHECTIGEMVYSYTETTSWVYNGFTQSCENGAGNHQDKWYTRTVIKVYECTYCGIEDASSYEQDKYVCTQ